MEKAEYDCTHKSGALRDSDKMTGASKTSVKDPYSFDTTPKNTHMLLIERVPNESLVLEVGSASGYMGEYLQKNKNCTVYGIEPDTARAAEAEGRGYEAVFCGTSDDAISAGVFSGKEFDVLLLADVLEHIWESEKALERLLPFVKNGGRVVVSLPNVAHYSVIAMLFRGEWKMASAGIMDRTHMRWFTRKSAMKMFTDVGLSVEEVRPAAGYIERRWGGFGKYLLFAWPDFFAPQFIFVCNKKSSL